MKLKAFIKTKINPNKGLMRNNTRESAQRRLTIKKTRAEESRTKQNNQNEDDGTKEKHPTDAHITLHHDEG